MFMWGIFKFPDKKYKFEIENQWIDPKNLLRQYNLDIETGEGRVIRFIGK